MRNNAEGIGALVRERDGSVPDCRTMVGLLAERGMQVGHVTVSLDYKALELKTARIHQREAKASELGKQRNLCLSDLGGHLQSLETVNKTCSIDCV